MLTADNHTRKRIETILGKAGVSTFQGETIRARIEAGSWLADCPCKGAQYVRRGEQMLCGDCGADHDVEFPPPKKQERIEHLLGLRPNQVNRNWTPGETVEDLEAENIDHGVWEDM